MNIKGALLDQFTGAGAMLASIVLLGLLAGCAGTSHQSPTHQWVSFDRVASTEYRADNNACSHKALGETGVRTLQPDTAEYQHYVSCMNSKGYELAAVETDE